MLYNLDYSDVFYCDIYNLVFSIIYINLLKVIFIYICFYQKSKFLLVKINGATKVQI
jgi:hypothetical protein